MSGPNDFHGEIIDGTYVQLPGLGSYEPPKTAAEVLASEPPDKRELRRKEAELSGIELRLAERAAMLDAKEKALASVIP